jgi:hypothetical protein
LEHILEECALTKECRERTKAQVKEIVKEYIGRNLEEGVGLKLFKPWWEGEDKGRRIPRKFKRVGIPLEGLGRKLRS